MAHKVTQGVSPTGWAVREQITNGPSCLVTGVFAGMCPPWWTREVTSGESQVTSSNWRQLVFSSWASLAKETFSTHAKCINSLKSISAVYLVSCHRGKRSPRGWCLKTSQALIGIFQPSRTTTFMNNNNTGLRNDEKLTLELLGPSGTGDTCVANYCFSHVQFIFWRRGRENGLSASNERQENRTQKKGTAIKGLNNPLPFTSFPFEHLYTKESCID